MKLEGKVSIRQGDGYSGKCYVCECEDLPMIYAEGQTALEAATRFVSNANKFMKIITGPLED